MSDLTVKNIVKPEELETAETAENSVPGKANSRRLCNYILKKTPRSMAIMACFVGCCYFLVVSANRLNAGVILQEFKATSSVDNENLQITVCPVGPFDPIHLMDYKIHTKRANNLRALSKQYNINQFAKTFHTAMDCLHDNKYAHRDDTIAKKAHLLQRYPECISFAEDVISTDFPYDLLEIYTWLRNIDLLYTLGLTAEGGVDSYDGIYRNIDILIQDNSTLAQYLTETSRDIEEFLVNDFTSVDNVNLNKPAQKILVNNALRTRFGMKCISYTMANSEDGKKLNQRFQLQMTFNRLEWAYLLVSVHVNRTFSDIPGATLIQPYRIPLDTTSVLHIRRNFFRSRNVAWRVFQGNISDCNDLCTPSCEQLNILVKIMGEANIRRFCNYILKKIPRTMAIMACFVGCCYFLIVSANRLDSDVILQEFKATSSVSKENLQITVCPVAPFDPIQTLDFKAHTKRANYLRKLDTTSLNSHDFSKNYIRAMKCLYASKYSHEDEPVEEKIHSLALHTECMTFAGKLFTSDYPNDLLEVYTWFRTFLSLKMLELDREGDVDSYDEIYKNIDILKQDNSTLSQYLKDVSRDMEEFFTSDFTSVDNINLNKPAQKVIVNNAFITRFGMKCTSYTLADSEKGKKLNQRYQLQMTFNRVEFSYLLVFVNENRTFSDIPGATLIQPYRIPLDTTSILHIRRIEKTIKNERLENCKSYDRSTSPGSHVECMEACILKKVVTHQNLTCLMPWMDRNSTRGLINKPFCNTSEEFLRSRDAVQSVFQGNTSDCNIECTEGCEKLNILVKIMGIVKPAIFSNEQRHNLIFIVSNEMDEFRNRPAYGWGDFISEVFGSLSFILGIAFVALIDWVFAALLWLCGKLPYIPAMPPILNSDIYIRDIYFIVRHELYGEPIPMTISQTYLKKHEHRRDAFQAAPSTTEKTDSDHRRPRPQFPRMHQRKSSLALMSEAIAAVSHQHEEAVLMQQFKSLSEVIRRGSSVADRDLQKRSSFPPGGRSQQTSPSVRHPSGATASSSHGMPTKWSEPKITISAPDEDDYRERSQTPSPKSEPDEAEHESQPETQGAPGQEAIDTGQPPLTPAKSGLPGIDQQRRPSRAASVLRDLDAAEASPSTAEGAAAPQLPAQGQRRASLYRTKPRRKSHAVAPAPAPAIAESSEGEEPPD
ncbi:uncharacterized protein LOC122394065 isoform X2 [Amphibalanus amphitrite]|uniref:uncharacterized protein LOC122394065 isoform X2 n=1 Tax=Amphibalanus amphitrite TaxID=1232801 RepID=UPI001C9180A2|nr:uncharacterized protein LOC122394065 isoform X2 [Amphibalanus amphitrite]